MPYDVKRKDGYIVRGIEVPPNIAADKTSLRAYLEKEANSVQPTMLDKALGAAGNIPLPIPGAQQMAQWVGTGSVGNPFAEQKELAYEPKIRVGVTNNAGVTEYYDVPKSVLADKNEFKYFIQRQRGASGLAEFGHRFMDNLHSVGGVILNVPPMEPAVKTALLHAGENYGTASRIANIAGMVPLPAGAGAFLGKLMKGGGVKEAISSVAKGGGEAVASPAVAQSVVAETRQVAQKNLADRAAEAIAGVVKKTKKAKTAAAKSAKPAKSSAKEHQPPVDEKKQETVAERLMRIGKKVQDVDKLAREAGVQLPAGEKIPPAGSVSVQRLQEATKQHAEAKRALEEAKKNLAEDSARLKRAQQGQ